MSQEDLIARAKAKEGLESVFSARDSSQIDFSQINNKANGGIFLDDFAPIYDPPGVDGIANTDDDSNSANSHQSFHQRQTLLAFFLLLIIRFLTVLRDVSAYLVLPGSVLWHRVSHGHSDEPQIVDFQL
jgi:hypothetical protein